MKLFSQALLEELAAHAMASPRQRVNHNVHASSSDLVQRFFVAAHRPTYFRPHRHLAKSELAIVIRGRFDVITFDGTGTVTARHSVGEGAASIGFETPRATWHTLIAQADGSVFFEVKEGPYDPATAVEFAPWAPPEGHASAPAFLEWARTAATGSRVPATTPPATTPPATGASGSTAPGSTTAGSSSASSTVAGPAAPGPTVAGPTVPGSTVAGPTAPGPTIAGPTIAGATVAGP
jgi:cupin fold WbuC family metalloprotein